jgi:hypothetical protein
MAIMNVVMARIASELLAKATEAQWNMIRGSTLHAEEAFKTFNVTTEDKAISEEELESVLVKIFDSLGGITGQAIQAYFASMMKKVFG